ncbi:MAG: HAMP domain-containing histidine kinase [Hyphomonadaceae bacterium]|nr:HAMP domain-containing histidine kinase [Hyphomonadaceae bacterium]
MTQGPAHSLQFRLAIRLALVYALAAIIGIVAIAVRAYDVEETLRDRELRLRAMDISRSVVIDAAGVVRLELPPSLAGAYASTGEEVFAIRTADGRVLAAQPRAFGDQVARWPLATDEPSWFQVKNGDDPSIDLSGLSVAIDSPAGALSITVAQASGAHALVESVVNDFIFDAVRWIPLLLVATLGAGVWAIRSGLAPISQVSHIAAKIGPDDTNVRLPEHNVPVEIAPLVASMNRALDRLDRGFAVQREFTANAAHELRTPLAILTAALDGLPSSGEVDKLKADVARMNRLVEQLMRVARLDALPLDITSDVDLHEIAASVVAAVAPLAIMNRQTLELIADEGPTFVKGNVHAIEDAIRNLIENAMAHSPEGAPITVKVGPPDSVSVSDRGPGISAEDRARIFERFWRGSDARAGGAGLGLSIVGEIMKAHQGTVSIEDNPDGGAVLKLSFRRASGPS